MGTLKKVIETKKLYVTQFDICNTYIYIIIHIHITHIHIYIYIYVLYIFAYDILLKYVLGSCPGYILTE